jgi:septal ring factor EnvC (AmiA/AmiB activator)
MRIALMRALALATGLSVAGGLLAARAEEARAPHEAVRDLSARQEAAENELNRVRADQKKAEEAEKRFETELNALRAERRRLSEQLVVGAQRVREVEDDMARLDQRLADLAKRQRELKASLDQRHDLIGELVAALQRIGRQPPPALIARPEEALAQLRGALAFGALVPELRREAEILVADLTEASRLEATIADERRGRDAALAKLGAERDRLAALIDERQRQQGTTETAMRAERTRAAQLARQSDSVRDLVNRLERDIAAAREAAQHAARAEAEAAARAETERLGGAGRPPEATSGSRLAFATPAPARMAPAIPFARARGQLQLPVNGVRLRQFGQSDGMGGTERGLTLATRAGATVTSPADGWIVYAGPFRSYGQILILNTGGGYHILLAGVDRVSVDLGQFVLAGEPVAVMGSGSSASVASQGSAQPTLYIEFRKDGTPVDPAPWWSVNEQEKGRG